MLVIGSSEVSVHVCFFSVTATRNTAVMEPFVEENGQYLDFTLATADDSDHYRCTGVDELGNSAVATFYVTVNNDGITHYPLIILTP